MMNGKRRAGRLVVISGKNGSGKSEYAERLLCRVPSERYYIATMIPATPENHERIRKHRDRRKDMGFTTLEIRHHVAEAPVPDGSSVLLEDVSNLLANEMFDGARKEDEFFSGRCGKEPERIGKDMKDEALSGRRGKEPALIGQDMKDETLSGWRGADPLFSGTNMNDETLFEKDGTGHTLTGERIVDDVCGDIFTLLEKCETLIAVTVSSFEEGDYSEETECYRRALARLNNLLEEHADTVVSMEDGRPVMIKEKSSCHKNYPCPLPAVRPASAGTD